MLLADVALRYSNGHCSDHGRQRAWNAWHVQAGCQIGCSLCDLGHILVPREERRLYMI